MNDMETCIHHVVPVEIDGKWYLQCEYCEGFVVDPAKLN